jgi:hypothetical protein
MDSRITHSQMQCAGKCLRKHELAYILGLRPIMIAEPLRIGSVCHKIMELAQTIKKEPEFKDESIDTIQLESLKRVLSKSQQNVIDENQQPTPEEERRQYYQEVERHMIWNLMSGYFWRWQQYDAQMQWIAPEMSFQIPIETPTGTRVRGKYLAGKIDGIVQLPDGRLAVIEHKTTSSDLSPESDYWLRLRCDQQISLYFLAARSLGYDVTAICYDVIRKPEIRPSQIPMLDENNVKIVLDAQGQRVKTKDGKKWRESGDKELGYVLQTRTETPEEYGKRLWDDLCERPNFYYERQEIPRVDADIDRAKADLYQWTQLINFCQKKNFWPRNSGACIGFGRCPYFGLCSSGYQHGTSIIPEGFEIVTDVHQELLQEE